jgi:hypothetical protein
VKDYVFTLAKTTSTLAKNEMNSIINKVTIWSQDRLVGVVTCYKLDGQGSIPSQMGVLAWGVKLTPDFCVVLWCLMNQAQRLLYMDRMSIGNFIAQF